MRHLAIRTPDHAMEYASFSGSIPEGEYGGGEVRIFDHGEYELVDRNEERLTFRLEGERLAGVWHLVYTGPKDGKEQWLAIMSEDLRPPADERPPLEPMLATLTAEAFDDPEWGFEPKWDGIRAIAVCDEETRLISRNDHDITVAYPELQRLHDQVVALEAVLDGEIVAFDNGVPSFQRLQQRMHLRDQRQIERAGSTDPGGLHRLRPALLDGKDLTDQPLEERRRILEEAIVPPDRIQISPITEGPGNGAVRGGREAGAGGDHGQATLLRSTSRERVPTTGSR